MENLKIEVEETKTYNKRMFYAFSLRLLIVIIPAFLFSYESGTIDKSWLLLCLCLLPIYIIFLAFYCDKICAYHINLIEINETYVHIIYKKRDENLELDDVLERFKFNYCPRYRVPAFIKIEYNGVLAIRQHRVWAWKHSGFFDQTKEYLENHKLLYSTWSML